MTTEGSNLAATAKAAIEILGSGAIETAMLYCAEELVLELPYTPGNGLEPFYTGKPAVRECMNSALGPDGRFSKFRFYDIETCQLAGQSRVLAEYKSEGTIKTTGVPYANRYVTVLTFADGLITRWCEFFNPLAAPAPAEPPRPQ